MIMVLPSTIILTTKTTVCCINARFFCLRRCATLNSSVRRGENGSFSCRSDNFTLARKQYMHRANGQSGINQWPETLTMRTSGHCKYWRRVASRVNYTKPLPWHCLYFLPLPQGQGSLRPTLGPAMMGCVGRCGACEAPREACSLARAACSLTPSPPPRPSL